MDYHFLFLRHKDYEIEMKLNIVIHSLIYDWTKNRKYSYQTTEYIRRQFKFDLIQNDEGDD